MTYHVRFLLTNVILCVTISNNQERDSSLGNETKKEIIL